MTATILHPRGSDVAGVHLPSMQGRAFHAGGYRQYKFAAPWMARRCE
jgi:hypothetical protein